MHLLILHVDLQLSPTTLLTQGLIHVSMMMRMTVHHLMVWIRGMIAGRPCFFLGLGRDHDAVLVAALVWRFLFLPQGPIDCLPCPTSCSYRRHHQKIVLLSDLHRLPYKRYVDPGHGQNLNHQEYLPPSDYC